MGVSGNSVAGKSFQMFTVSEELLAKVVEAVRAGEKQARTSGEVQSFEVFYHGFRANISIGRIYVVPASVCSDRKNFPTALLYGCVVRHFGGEEVGDLVEKKIGVSEFDEYSQADFDSIRKEVFTDCDGEVSSLVVYAPNWMNAREYVCFHFHADEDMLKNSLRHQVFSAYFDPRVSSAFNAMMTNVDTTKVDVCDITPKLQYPFLSESPLRQFPALSKQAGARRVALLNRRTADEITKQVLDPEELDVFETLDQALSNALMPETDTAEEAAGEGGYQAPEKDDVPRTAGAKAAAYPPVTVLDGLRTEERLVLNQIQRMGGFTWQQKAEPNYQREMQRYDSALQEIRRKIKAEEGREPRVVPGGEKLACAPFEAPVTNVGPGTGAARIQGQGAGGMETEQPELDHEEQGLPVGIPVDETGVPRREGEEPTRKGAAWPFNWPFKKKDPQDDPDNPFRVKNLSKEDCPRCGCKPGDAHKSTCRPKSPMRDLSDTLSGSKRAEAQSTADSEAELDSNPLYQAVKSVPKAVGDAAGNAAGALADVPEAAALLASKRANRRREGSHPETLRVDPTRLSSAVSAAFDGGFVDRHGMPPQSVRAYIQKNVAGNTDYAKASLDDHARQIEAGAYGETPFDRRSQEKWGAAGPAATKRADGQGNVRRGGVGATHPTGDAFTDSYIETALWSSYDEADESGGEPMDKNYSYTDLSKEALKVVTEDCKNFQSENRELLDRAHSEDGQDARRQGHDFWLTRNHHGAGYWDGDYPETGDALTEAAHAYGECTLYVGDDGYVYTFEGANSPQGKLPLRGASYVASRMAKLVDYDGSEAMSAKSRKARAEREARLGSLRGKQAVSLDIDSIWDEITEDMGPAPVVPTPGGSGEGGGEERPAGTGDGRPRKSDTKELPAELRGDSPEDTKSLTDDEAEGEEDLVPSAKEGAWRLDSKYADFVDDVAGDQDDDAPEDGVPVWCNQCEMLSINGVPTHEHGCPNSRKVWDPNALPLYQTTNPNRQYGEWVDPEPEGDFDEPEAWVDSHSVTCHFCGGLLDEREAVRLPDGEGEAHEECALENHSPEDLGYDKEASAKTGAAKKAYSPLLMLLLKMQEVAHEMYPGVDVQQMDPEQQAAVMGEMEKRGIAAKLGPGSEEAFDSLAKPAWAAKGKRADTSDNPHNWAGGDGAPVDRKDVEKADTSGPDAKCAAPDDGDYKYAIQLTAEQLAEETYGADFYALTDEQQMEVYADATARYWDCQAARADQMNDARLDKSAADVGPDVAEARTETASPDTVDPDIQQPTESLAEAAKTAAGQEGVAEFADRLADAYSTDYYGGWAGCIRMLRKRGYSDREVEAIIRSKHTRWAYDSSGKSRATSADLARYMDASPYFRDKKEVDQLVRETPFKQDEPAGPGPADQYCNQCGGYRDAGAECSRPCRNTPKLAAGKCKKCGRKLVKDGTCSNVACEYFRKQQSEKGKEAAGVEKDVAGARALLDYDKAQTADEPHATRTVDPAHLAYVRAEMRERRAGLDSFLAAALSKGGRAWSDEDAKVASAFVEWKMAAGMNLAKALQVFEDILDDHEGASHGDGPTEGALAEEREAVNFLRNLLGKEPREPKGLPAAKAPEPGRLFEPGKPFGRKEEPRGPSGGNIIKVPQFMQGEALPDNAQWTNRTAIKSESSGRMYTIAQNKSGRWWACSCPGWIGHKKCKHLRALGLPPNYTKFEAQLKTGSAGDDRPEEAAFEFGGGDLAGIVLTEEGGDE